MGDFHQRTSPTLGDATRDGIARLRPDEPVCLAFFCVDLLHHIDFQLTVDQQLTQPGVLRLQRFQSFDLIRFHATELLTPHVIGEHCSRRRVWQPRPRCPDRIRAGSARFARRCIAPSSHASHSLRGHCLKLLWIEKSGTANPNSCVG